MLDTHDGQERAFAPDELRGVVCGVALCAGFGAQEVVSTEELRGIFGLVPASLPDEKRRAPGALE
ncbi:MAG TPA: hypothetical protein VGB05_09570 [Pyrinomonadaceae bacterium]